MGATGKGVGGQKFNLQNVQAGGDLTIKGGPGDDSIYVERSRANAITINAGNGVNDVTLSATTGGGNDSVTLFGTNTVLGTTTFRAGGFNDVLFNKAVKNTFHASRLFGFETADPLP